MKPDLIDHDTSLAGDILRTEEWKERGIE